MSTEINKNYNDTSKLSRFQKFFFDYGKYHNTVGNVIVHIIFVPLIILTLEKIIGELNIRTFKMPINPFWSFNIILAAIYLYTDFVTGLMTIIEYPLLSYLTRNINFGFAGLSNLQGLLVIHAVAWIVQFIAHGFIEHRRPALVDNIFLTINAPVFVNIELLYYLFGFRKQEVDEVKEYINYEIHQFHSKGKKGE
jgi:uncharacterized membrane protein YGL010W